MAEKEDKKSPPITIKKYANRRLYNTATSSYVTLDHLCQMVKDGIDFVVYDAKTGEDITRSVLTQIIVEEESKGQNLLPISFLRQLIGFYGDNMQWMVPRYLEYAMHAFARNQEQMRDYFQNTLGGMFPFGGLEEVGKQNLAMIERAMRVFTPFNAELKAEPKAGDPASERASDASIEELQRKIEDLQKQVAGIAKAGRPR
jgi:polyhydroxyalkanoate synthesis repressor PhaR